MIFTNKTRWREWKEREENAKKDKIKAIIGRRKGRKYKLKFKKRWFTMRRSTRYRTTFKKMAVVIHSNISNGIRKSLGTSTNVN